MAGLNETLKKNPFKDMIISVIGMFQHKYANQHDMLLVANLLYKRGKYWGRIMPKGIASETDGTGGVLQREQSEMMYGNDRRPGKRNHASIVENLERKLDSMNMDSPNAWVYWQQIVDTYYANVPFVSHFMQTYKQGKYATFFLGLIGGYVRPDAQTDGVTTAVTTQGSVGVSEVFTIDYAKTAAAQLNDRYFIVYDTAANQYVIWFNVDGAGTQPVVGGTTSYHVVAISSSDLPADVQAATNTAIDVPLTATVVDAGLLSTWTITATGVVTDIDGVTAEYGIVNANTNLIASDTSTLASGLVTDLQWQDSYNSLLVPYEEALDINVPYIKVCSVD